MMLKIFEGGVYAVAFMVVGLTIFECFMSANCLWTFALT
jgi:hypothetical protein